MGRRMDREDRKFVNIVGDKACKLIRTKNPKLWMVFRQACEENGEKPESVMGSMLLQLTKSILNGNKEYVEDVMNRTIKVSAIIKRDELSKKVDELINLRKKISSSEAVSTNIDKLIEQLIVRELSNVSFTPTSMLQYIQQPQNVTVVIDDKLLSSMSDEELYTLRNIVDNVIESRKAIKKFEETSKEVTEVAEEKESVEGSDEHS